MLRIYDAPANLTCLFFGRLLARLFVVALAFALSMHGPAACSPLLLLFRR